MNNVRKILFSRKLTPSSQIKVKQNISLIVFLFKFLEHEPSSMNMCPVPEIMKIKPEF